MSLSGAADWIPSRTQVRTQLQSHPPSPTTPQSETPMKSSPKQTQQSAERNKMLAAPAKDPLPENNRNLSNQINN